MSIEGAKNIWVAILGPDTRPRGEWTNIDPVYQNQIAATLAASLGDDYHLAVPKSGKPIASPLVH